MTNDEKFELINTGYSAWFNSPREIIDDIMLKYSLEEINNIIIQSHHRSRGEFCRFIRNEYKLWEFNNPFTMEKYVPEMSEEGFDCSVYHPDNFSYIIFNKLIQEVAHETNTN